MKTTRVKMDVDIPVTAALKQWLIENTNVPSTLTDESLYAEKALKCLGDGTLSGEKLLELCDDMTVSPEKVFGHNGDGHHIRIKSPSEQYSDARYTAKSAKTGQPVFDPIYQRDVLTPSSAANARMGCLFKHLANRSGLVSNPLSEHEKALLDELVNEHDWAGKVSNEHFEKVSNSQVKALLDDSTSGGLEIAPIHFDADVISFPLLYGELFPLIDLRPVPRGRRIEGASIATPTMTWGGVDGTEISLFSTTSMVNAIDTTIFAIDGAVELSRDLLSDSPVEVGSILTSLVGERLMEELDTVIANGNGSTQPEGLFQKSGVSTVTPDNTTTGPPSLDDYLDLMFAVGKQYRRQSAFRCSFVSNDTSYQRSKAIRVDPASPSTDQRPVLSPLTEVNDYRTLGWPHKIQNDLANGTAGFFAMSRYRMYRRMGLEMRFVDDGKELARKNLMLLVYRARYGGQLMDANAGAKWTNGQS